MKHSLHTHSHCFFFYSFNVLCSEFKRRQKQRETEAKKAAKKAAAPPAPATTTEASETNAAVIGEEEEINPSKYFENRSKQILKMRETLQPANPYPHKFEVSMSISDFIAKYADSIEPGARAPEGTVVTLAGRIHNIRSSGAKLKFYGKKRTSKLRVEIPARLRKILSFTRAKRKQHLFFRLSKYQDLHGEGLKVQIMAQAQDSERDFATVHDVLNRGDIVGVKGVPGKSKKGELSIFPKDITLLTPCLRTLPSANYGFKDQESRYRKN